MHATSSSCRLNISWMQFLHHHIHIDRMQKVMWNLSNKFSQLWCGGDDDDDDESGLQ